MDLAPDFVREYDRVATADNDLRVARVIVNTFGFLNIIGKI